jgi:hypothetical protein
MPATAYTPTTDQPITRYQPVLLTAPSGAARFDHDPITGESLGLLIEEQRTNLVLRSEEFNDAAWTKTRASITANTIVAPDGTLTGDKLVEDTTASNTHLFAASATTTSGVTYTASIYVKAAERSWIYITAAAASFGSDKFAFFNVSPSSPAVGFTAGVTASITSAGNNWYRCVISVAASVTGTQNAFQLNLSTGDASYGYTGDGTSGIFLWGAQLEAGSFPTSYIKTEASQQTRNADAASMTGVNFSSWFRADEGTFVFSGSSNAVNTPNSKVFFGVATSGVFGESMYLVNIPSNINVVVATLDNGVSQVESSAGNISSGSEFKLSFGYTNNDVAASLRGATAITDTSATLPIVNTLALGTAPWNLTSNFLNGTIKRFTYYPARLSNAQLQALTA